MLGAHKNTNDSNFLPHKGPDSSPTGPMSLDCFIQPKRYVDGSFYIEYITLWSLQNISTISTFSCTGARQYPQRANVPGPINSAEEING